MTQILIQNFQFLFTEIWSDIFNICSLFFLKLFIGENMDVVYAYWNAAYYITVHWSLSSPFHSAYPIVYTTYLTTFWKLDEDAECAETFEKNVEN